jgi:hypothetical protein
LTPPKAANSSSHSSTSPREAKVVADQEIEVAAPIRTPSATSLQSQATGTSPSTSSSTHLAGKHPAGESSPHPFFPVPSIQIRWPRIEGLTKSVPAYSAAPCRPGWSAPSQTRQNEFKFEIQISDSVLILQNRYKIKYLAKNCKLGIPEILEMCRIHFCRETTGVLYKFLKWKINWQNDL